MGLQTGVLFNWLLSSDPVAASCSTGTGFDNREKGSTFNLKCCFLALGEARSHVVQNKWTGENIQQSLCHLVHILHYVFYLHTLQV